MMQKKLWRFFTKILGERAGSGEGVTTVFPILPTFSAKIDRVVTLFFGLRNSVTKKLWGKYANFYAVSKAVENWCFSVQAVENHNFSTDSTGFSTALLPVEKSCGYAVFVDIIFCPFAGGFRIFCDIAILPILLFSMEILPLDSTFCGRMCAIKVQRTDFFAKKSKFFSNRD